MAIDLRPDSNSCLQSQASTLPCAMPKRSTAVVCANVFAAAMMLHLALAAVESRTAHDAKLVLKAHTKRTSPTDLEIGGDVKGLPPGAMGYLTREDLLTLPQETYTVRDDTNFKGPTQVQGIFLENLIRALAIHPDSDLVIAICGDQYHAHYTRAYLASHHPMLVLEVNGHAPERWPTSTEGDNQAMGPYMISHREFKPGFKILAHSEEPQVPWGVVRLDFQSETGFFHRIAPRGPHASDATVQAGYRIAQQNCLRCHNAGDVGGQKAQHPWLVLSAWATASPKYFAGYVRYPQAENPRAEMYPNPGYDNATLNALIAYFKTFSLPEQP
jgi:mono/diheme cytochrome c family protein